MDFTVLAVSILSPLAIAAVGFGILYFRRLTIEQEILIERDFIEQRHMREKAEEGKNEH